MKIQTIFTDDSGHQFTEIDKCLKSYKDKLVDAIGERIVDKMKLPFGINPVLVAECIADNLHLINKEAAAYEKKQGASQLLPSRNEGLRVMKMNQPIDAKRESFKTPVSKKGTFTATATAAYSHIQKFNSTILLVHDGDKWQAWARAESTNQRRCNERGSGGGKRLRTDQPGMFFEFNLKKQNENN